MSQTDKTNSLKMSLLSQLCRAVIDLGFLYFVNQEDN